MKLLDIIEQSTFCSTGYISKIENISVLERFILHNFSVISKFPKIIVAHGKDDSITESQLSDYNNVWIKHFKDKCVVISRPNYGHTFGSVDKDNSVLEESKRFGYKWAWKSTNDILITEKIFNVEMEDGEFFYLQGHGVAGIQGYYQNDIELAVNSLGNEDWGRICPQTNFFITNLKGDKLIDLKSFNESYERCKNDPDYKTNPIQVEYKYMMAEGILKDYIQRNMLIMKHLIGKDSYRKLIKAIQMYNIVDSSHKNVFFEECGVCHYHYFEENVIEI